jgi:putative hydrolase of the HAD superfamily
MPPAAVLLDLYDTLVNGDWPAWGTQLASITGLSTDDVYRAYHETRLDRNTGRFDSAAGEVRALLGAAGLDPSEDLVRDVVEAEAAFGLSVRPYADALPTVRELRARGHALALVSNCSHATRAIVDRLGFAELFDTIVLSFELGVRKPDAGIYRQALTALGTDPASALFVDDQTPYCDGARALGIDTRLIVRPSATPAEGFAPSTNGHAVIEDLTALL